MGCVWNACRAGGSRCRAWQTRVAMSLDERWRARLWMGQRGSGPWQARVGLLQVRARWRRRRGYAIAIGGTAVLTAAFLPVRDLITPLAKGFGFLVMVVAAAAVGGLGPGIVASLLGFLTFNFFFLPPYNTFIIGRAEYVVVLFVFLGLSILISGLLSRATARAEMAEAREEELRPLQTLSSELVAAVPGRETYRAILARLLDTFGFAAGSLWVRDPESRELREEVTVGRPAGSLTPRQGAASGSPVHERLALSVGGRVLGLLILERASSPLTPAESRVLRAFCDQFALVLERDRLLRSATEAEALRRTEEIRRSLLAAVSHDLRSPLAAIKASVTDLLSTVPPGTPASWREALEDIDRETDRLIALVTNLLDMSRIEGGMLKPRLQTVDLGEAIDAVVQRLHLQWPTLAIGVSIREDAVFARADPVFLERVLANLADNAVKASARRGVHRIEIEARRAGSTVTVRVIDHGPGVPSEVREQLFHPFYRLHDRHPRLGTGLGLAIAKGFLALMDGDIWIEETPGGGATFAFSLPASDAVSAA